ncbi:MAG: hypothetical protein HN368_03070 [Spirochaetales bacterium]|nr:hypothetical protein [Spirochaetales bacterium]
MKDLFTLLSNITGRKPPAIIIPVKLTSLIGLLAEVTNRILGRQPRYTRKSLKILTLGVRVSGELAKERLGYAPRSAKESLLDTIQWLEE